VEHLDHELNLLLGLQQVVVRIRTADGPVVIVKTLNRYGEPVYPSGSTFTLGWHPSDGRALHD
jgi:hypothetical protein